jgi:hypothetical protein
MELIHEMIVRFLEKHCKEQKDWCEMERELLKISTESIREYRELTKDNDGYSPARKHNL